MDISTIILSITTAIQEYRTRRWIIRSYADATGYSKREVRNAIDMFH